MATSFQARVKPAVDGGWEWEVLWFGLHGAQERATHGTAHDRIAAVQAAKQALHALSAEWEVVA